MTSLMLQRSGLAALIAALLLWPAFAQQELAITIARIGGTVEVQHAIKTKGAWTKAKKDQVIGSGWNLRTAAESKAQLVFPLDNVVILKENSLLTVDNLDAGGGAKVNAKSGSLLVDIQRALAPGSTFEVKTPSALAVVRGTKFSVEIGPATAERAQGGAGGRLVAMNFMLAGQPMKVVQASPSFSVLLGGGSGDAFEAEVDGEWQLVLPGTAAALLLPAVQKVRSAAARMEDVNGDGRPDIVIAAGDGSVRVADESAAAGDSSGRQTREHVLLAVGDIDGDGLDDYVIQGGEESAEGIAELITSAAGDPLKAEAHFREVTGQDRSDEDSFKDNVRTARELGSHAAPDSAGAGSPDSAAGTPGNRQEFSPQPASKSFRTLFHGYSGRVEIGNEHGVSFMTPGTSVEVDGDSAPGAALPSGEEAQAFLEDAESTELFDAFDAAAEAASADLGAIRAALEATERQLTQYEQDFARHVRQQDIGKLMLIWVQLPALREGVDDSYGRMWEVLGGSGEPETAEVLVGLMQEQGVPDSDLPPLATDIRQRIEDLLIELEPYLKGQDELLDRAQGLIEPGDPRGSIRNDLIDTDNDGIGDALELELGTDPLLNNGPGGFIQLIAPDDGEMLNFPPDAPLQFEFEALDSEADLVYNLVLEAGGQQVLRRNVRELERMTLAQLAGPGGLLEAGLDGNGLLSVDWRIEAQLRRGRPGSGAISSETRSFSIQTPDNDLVEVNLRGLGAARLGSVLQIGGDITEVAALGEWEIEVQYDPALLAFTQGGKAGLFGPSTVFFSDNGNGLLTISGRVPQGNAGLGGQGDIFVLTFNPLLPGTTTVQVGRVTLRDALGRDIEGRAGDEAELTIARGGSTSPAGPGVPGGGSVTPGGRVDDSASLPGLGPLLLSAPANGSSIRFPAETELEFEFDELDTKLDVVYNLYLSSGGAQKKYSDFVAGDAIALDSLLLGAGPFAKSLGAGGLTLDWRVEAELDAGGGQPLRVSSETWRVSIGGPQNSMVTLDLSAIGQSSKLKVGDPLRVRGTLSEVEGLGEFEFIIRYDSAVLDFVSGRKVGLLNSASVKVDDSGPGKLRVSGNMGGQGISGSGAVFELEFAAAGDGSAVVEADQVHLSDILGQAINGDAGDEVDVDVLDPAKGGGAGAPGGPRDPFGRQS